MKSFLQSWFALTILHRSNGCVINILKLVRIRNQCFFKKCSRRKLFCMIIQMQIYVVFMICFVANILHKKTVNSKTFSFAIKLHSFQGKRSKMTSLRDQHLDEGHSDPEGSPLARFRFEAKRCQHTISAGIYGLGFLRSSCLLNFSFDDKL